MNQYIISYDLFGNIYINDVLITSGLLMYEAQSLVEQLAELDTNIFENVLTEILKG